MPSSDSTATGRLRGNKRLLVAIGAGAVLFVVLAAFLGFGAFGVVVALLYFGVLFAVVALALWLFYRLVVAVERIADAQQRIAGRRGRPETPDRE